MANGCQWHGYVRYVSTHVIWRQFPTVESCRVLLRMTICPSFCIIVRLFKGLARTIYASSIIATTFIPSRHLSFLWLCLVFSGLLRGDSSTLLTMLLYYTIYNISKPDILLLKTIASTFERIDRRMSASKLKPKKALFWMMLLDRLLICFW